MRKTKIVKLLPYAICVLFITGSLVFGGIMKYPIKSSNQIAVVPDPPDPPPPPDPPDK